MPESRTARSQMTKTNWIRRAIWLPILFLTYYALWAYALPKLQPIDFPLFGVLWNAERAMLAALILHAILSIRIVRENEIGAVVLLGLPVLHVSAGPAFVPFGFCWLRKETSNEIEAEIPAEPERVYHGDDPVTPLGYFPPNRATFAAKGDLRDILRNRVTADNVPIIVSYVIKDYPTYLRRIGDQENAERVLEGVAVSTISDEMPKKTAGDVLEDLGTYSKAIETAIKGAVRDWGVELRRVRVKSIQFNHTFNESIQAPGKAVAAKAAAISTAEGEKQKL